MHLADVQLIKHRQHIAAQLFDGVGTFGHQRLTVAAGVETQYPKVLAEGRDLLVPHLQVSAQGVGKHQHRGILRPVESVVQIALGEFDESHNNLLSGIQGKVFGHGPGDPGLGLAEVVGRVEQMIDFTRG